MNTAIGEHKKQQASICGALELVENEMLKGIKGHRVLEV
jgi:hypothetical protein